MCWRWEYGSGLSSILSCSSHLEDGSSQAQGQLHTKKDHLHEGFTLGHGWHMPAESKCSFTSRSPKKCSSSLRRQPISKCGPGMWRQQLENSKTDLLTSKNKSSYSKKAWVQDCYWVVFLLLSPVLCLSSSSSDSQSNLKDQKETKIWSFSSSVLAKTVLADRLSTDGHQPLIQLLDCLDLISQPCSQIRCPDPESLHLTTLLLLGWISPRDTNPCICRDPDTVQKSIGGNVYVQVEKVLFISSPKFFDLTLLSKAFVYI